MKLRLDVQDNVSILTIAEEISPANIPVLKAGLNKLFQENRKVVILDLSGLEFADYKPPEVIDEITALKLWAAESGAQVTIASSLEGFGDSVNRQGVLEVLNSPLGRLLALEGRLTLQLKKLQALKTDLEARLQSAESSSGDILGMKRENGELKRRIEELEGLVRERLATRTSLYGTPMIKLGMTATERVLVSVLEREGVLPVT